MMIDVATNRQMFALEEETKGKVIDLLWKSIDGQLKQDQLLASLNELKAKHGKHFESLVADVVNLIDVEIGSFLNPGSALMVINSSSSSNEETAAQKKEKFYNLVNALRPFIGDELLKERLEIESLEALKLIAKKEVFNQKYIKIKTRLFYKQQKFNLLREEPEGYSKLITELGQTNLNGKVLENIQSLIGCFNLDPNRVLDIIIESFENQPSMYETYIALLKHYKPDEETICQIVGFKFQSLAASSATAAAALSDHHKSQSSSNNESLYKITSYLLKHELIDLDALLVHLSPTDVQSVQDCKDEMEAARQYAKKLSSIQLSAAPATDPNDKSGGSSGNSGGDFEKIEKNEPSQLVIQYQQYMAHKPVENQRVNLVKSLIEIEDYVTAMKLIERMPPWYLPLNFDVTVAICRSLDKNFIDSMYRRFNKLSSCLLEKYVRSSLNKPLPQIRSQRSMAFTYNTAAAANETTTEMEIDSNPKSSVDIDQMLDKFVSQILPLLCSIGPGLSYDTPLFTKLIRICEAFLNEKKFTTTMSSTNSTAYAAAAEHSNQKEQTPPPQGVAQVTQPLPPPSQVVKQMSKNELAFFNQIYTMLNEIILPSLSMLNMNPGVSIEVWNLLKLFPYEMRYNLYHNWRLSTYKLFPSLIRTKAECQEKIKYLLKRLTKENVKIHGRQIGKLSHNNPIIVCDYILAQIQRYDNFILPVVESLKFMTPLSYDILSYCIIVAISDAERDKMKHDSTNLSTWLQSIATFCALAFKKYPIELIAMIQFVINQLKNRKSYDLHILQEIVQKMSGIEVLSEVNDLQLEAMAGGDLLRQEAGYFNPIRNIKKCANRLKEALADYGLILPLCILLSQQRDYIVFLDQAEREKLALQGATADKTHLKLTGCFYDQCQDSLVQFSQFLSSTLTTEEYINIFPKIDELVQTYHVSPDVAFFLSRPMYAHHIQSKYDELRRADRNTKSAEKPSKTQRYLEAIEYVMQPVIDVARSLHPAKVWEDMSPLFYVTFWTLSMSDLWVPSTAYDKQRQSLRGKISALDDQLDLTSAKKKKEKEKLTLMIDKLTEEENKQRDHVGHVKARFDKEKDFWFPQKSKTKNDTITVFLQFCIFSRCLFTQIDAYYCAKFIQIIHSLKTPNFSTIICYDRIFSDISYSIASLTDNEARRYGRFLLGLLETVMTWHADPVVFEAECAQHPGFLTIFRNALNPTAATSSSSTTTPSTPASTPSAVASAGTPSNSSTSTTTAAAASNKQEQLDYENFRHVCHKWHYKLTKSFIVCLESDEYLQMRNALIILTKILPHYPKLTGFSTALEKRVEKLKQTERDKRQDIFTLASAYLGQLKIRKSLMVDESKFHLKEATATPATTHSDSNGLGDKAKSTSKLNTSSSAFKQPGNPSKNATSNVNGQSQSQSQSSTSRDRENSSPVPSSKQTSSNQVTSSSNSNSSADVIPINSSSSSTTNNQQNQSTSSSSNDKKDSSKSSSSKNDSSSSSRRLAASKEQQSSSSPSTPISGSPPSSLKATSKDDSSKAVNGSSSSNGKQSTTTNTTMKVASSVPSSPKPSTTANSNNSPTNGQQSETTPNDRTADYSPASSVSSDDLPVAVTPSPASAAATTSPSRRESTSTAAASSSSHQKSSSHHHSHSRSSSPVVAKSKSGNGGGKEAKRTKLNDESGPSQNGSSSKIPSSSTNSSISSETLSSSQTSSSQPSSQSSTVPSSQRSSSTSGSSKPHKLRRGNSRDRHSGESSSKDKDKDKEKKEHRKREHSIDSASDLGSSKKSKSDESKKLSSSSSGSSSKRSSKKNDLADDLNSSLNGDRRDERRSHDIKSSYKR